MGSDFEIRKRLAKLVTLAHALRPEQRKAPFAWGKLFKKLKMESIHHGYFQVEIL